MGYYTRYDFSCYEKDGTPVCFRDNKELEKQLIAKFNEIDSSYFDNDVDTIDEFFWDEIKWYDHDEDMKELSVYFPGYVFVLTGQGEDHDDSWRAFYHRGVSEISQARMVYSALESDFAQIAYDIYDDIEG